MGNKCSKGCIVAQSINENGNTFRQDTVGHFEVVVVTTDDQLVSQPEGFPTIEAVYIDPASRMMTTAIPQSQMYQIEPGRYYFDWKVPTDQPLLVHQVIYRGKIEEDGVIGEDIFTVLPITPVCLITPTVLTTNKAERGCCR
jgi:hypothetical protein